MIALSFPGSPSMPPTQSLWTPEEAGAYRDAMDPSLVVAMDDPRIRRFDRVRIYCDPGMVEINPLMVWATLHDETRVRCSLGDFPSQARNLRQLKTDAIAWGRAHGVVLKRLGFFDAIDLLT
jgi:hypothetical protein